MRQEKQTQRYYALDNLRVIAFGILILYHIGMYYVADWGWHIKSDVQYVWLQDVMILTNQWRMSLLFLISAMVLTTVLSRHSTLGCLKERTLRLFIPLVFGMFVIVAPQAFIEGKVNGIVSVPFWEFYSHYINPNTDYLPDEQSVIGLLTWNHLWFLPYLFCYSVIIILLYPLIRKLVTALPDIVDRTAVFVPLLIIAMTLIWYSLRDQYPVTHDLISDWYSHAKYGLVMVSGVIIVSRPGLWQNIVQHRRSQLLIAMSAYTLIILYRHDVLGTPPEAADAPVWLRPLVGIVVTANHWCWLGAILGYATRYLGHPVGMTQYLNRAVLPYYMLHQTLIVVLAYALLEYSLPEPLEFLIILVATVLGCMLGYEAVKRVSIVRLLFGIKGAVGVHAEKAPKLATQA